MTGAIVRKLRLQQGQTLIEMLAAMLVLSIAIAGLLAAFASSIISLRHAGNEGTALALADRQMETYRSLPYSCIGSSTTGCDSAIVGTFTSGTFPYPWTTSQTIAATDSPDHNAYTVTTSFSTSGTEKQITVSVALQSGGSELARVASGFTPSGST